MRFEISIISFCSCLITASLLTNLKAFAFFGNRENRYETLDGLRGFLAISVFFHHYIIIYNWKTTGIWFSPSEIYYQNYGKVGVAIFFMLSGFLFLNKIIHHPKKIK